MFRNLGNFLISKNYQFVNVHTGYLIMIIELLHFLNCIYCLRNHHRKFKFNRTIITWINFFKIYPLQIDGRTDTFCNKYSKDTLLKC